MEMYTSGFTLPLLPEGEGEVGEAALEVRSSTSRNGVAMSVRPNTLPKIPTTYAAVATIVQNHSLTTCAHAQRTMVVNVTTRSNALKSKQSAVRNLDTVQSRCSLTFFLTTRGSIASHALWLLSTVTFTMEAAVAECEGERVDRQYAQSLLDEATSTGALELARHHLTVRPALALIPLYSL